MKIRTLLLAIVLIGVLPLHTFAQGFFRAFSVPATAAATGQTEVLGSVQVSLQQGPPALADTLVIDVSPFLITNGSASDIAVTVSGNIVTGAVSIDSTAQHVNIPINAAATSGSVRVDGIRVALAGTNASSITAQLSWASQQNFLDVTSVPVVNSVQSALLASPITQPFQIFNNTVLNNSATISVHEGFASAFVSGSQYGETASTEIQIRVSDFPSGLQMQFPTTVTANESSATLTTLQGTPVTLPLSDGTTTVTYRFSGASNSATTQESFNIPFSVAVQGNVQLLQPTIDVALAPIGAAVPSDAVPSTSIPRYADDEESVLAGTSHIITQTLFWSGINDVSQNRLSIVNPGSYMSNLTLTAMDQNGVAISGNNISNPVTESIGANQSLDALLSDLFGNTTTMSTVRIDSTGPNVLALATVSSGSGTASIPLSNSALTNFSLPVFEAGGTLSLFDSGPLPVTGTLTLQPTSDSGITSKTISLNSMSETSFNIQDLFGVQNSGQILGAFSAPVIATESFGSNESFNLVVSQIPSEVSAFYVPFFVTGGGNETTLSVTDSSADIAMLNIGAYNAATSTMGPFQAITLQPNEQFTQTASQLIGNTTSSMTGYLQVQPALVNRGLFNSYPQVMGYARIQTGQATGTMPVFENPRQNLFILSSGVPAGTYQGISIVNPNSTTANVVLQVLSAAGNVTETATLTIGPGQILAKLTSELFSAAVPEQSVIRVTGDVPIIAVSAFGTFANDQLRFVLGQ